MPFLAFPVGGALTSGYCFQDPIRPQDGHKRQLVFFFFKHSEEGFRLDMRWLLERTPNQPLLPGLQLLAS